MKTQFVLLAVVLMLLTTGCASVIGTNKISGLQEIAVWKSESERAVKGAPATCETAYNGAHDRINAYLDTTLATEIAQIQKEFLSQIDLSSERIPAEVTKSVNAFLACNELRVYTFKDVEEAIKICQAVAEWAKREESKSRKGSATGLSDELTQLKWLEWKDVRK